MVLSGNMAAIAKDRKVRSVDPGHRVDLAGMANSRFGEAAPRRGLTQSTAAMGRP